MDKVKKPFYKKWWVWLIAVIIIVAIASPGDDEEKAEQDEPKKIETAAKAEELTDEEKEELEKKTAEEKVAAEEKAKKEAEEKEKADAEAKAEESRVKFDANGIFEVNSEIKPGIYRAENAGYWSRLKGFSGSFEEILANGNASGSTIVEILASDVGFETNGSGSWYLVDESYKPEILSTFGDGVYLVGLDIEPGKYKSEGAGYWARLSGFSGGFDTIVANDNISGPSIVEIQAGDKGFDTSGGIIWTKMD